MRIMVAPTFISMDALNAKSPFAVNRMDAREYKVWAVFQLIKTSGKPTGHLLLLLSPTVESLRERRWRGMPLIPQLYIIQQSQLRTTRTKDPDKQNHLIAYTTVCRLFLPPRAVEETQAEIDAVEARAKKFEKRSHVTPEDLERRVGPGPHNRLHS